MGYRTDFVGVIEVHPPLNDAEHSYLTAFAESRRFRHPAGPYAVPDNPMSHRGDDREVPIDDYNSPSPGQPGPWCPWRPGGRTCLYIPDEGDGKHYAPTQWLQYLAMHFLLPGALAAGLNSALFDGFTFDHQLTGAVAAYRHDTARLWLIRADNDDLYEETIVPGVSELPDWAINEVLNEAESGKR